MGGTREGALKAAATLKAKDPDYFKKLRARVKRPTGGKHAANGFDKDPERARSAGAAGGRKSRRSKTSASDQEAPAVHNGSAAAKDQADEGTHRQGSEGAGLNDQPTPGGDEA